MRVSHSSLSSWIQEFVSVGFEDALRMKIKRNPVRFMHASGRGRKGKTGSAPFPGRRRGGRSLDDAAKKRRWPSGHRLSVRPDEGRGISLLDRGGIATGRRLRASLGARGFRLGARGLRFDVLAGLVVLLLARALVAGAVLAARLGAFRRLVLLATVLPAGLSRLLVARLFTSRFLLCLTRAAPGAIIPLGQENRGGEKQRRHQGERAYRDLFHVVPWCCAGDLSQKQTSSRKQ